jgi:Thioredoxin-like
MKLYRHLLLILSLTSTVNTYAQDELKTTVPNAADIMHRAELKARNERKKILLIFHASWCVWCHRMDSSLNDPAIKKYFDDNFIITHVTVSESKGKEYLENKGGLALMDKYHGKDMGLPYWAVLNDDGGLLFDSRIQVKTFDGKISESAIGCPASESEVKRFVDILKKTTPLTSTQLDEIAARFRKNKY